MWTQELAENQKHTGFKVWDGSENLVPCLHCNVLVGRQHLITNKAAERMSHGKEEKKIANVRATVDEALTRTKFEEQ